MRNKKSQIKLFFIVSFLAFIVGVAITIIWLNDISTKVCKTNAECGDGNYCGFDHSCHKIPIIQKTTTVSIIKNNYGIAGLILGISIIISSLIIKHGKNE